jgi:hypothetical protein
VEYAEGRVVYFARLDPLCAVVTPILALVLALSLMMFAGWEFCIRKRLHKLPALHFLFLAACLAPLGIASVAFVRVLPFDLTPLVRAPWFWPAAFAAGAGPLIWAFRQPVRASRLARTVLLYSLPVLAVIMLAAIRESLLFPHAAYDDAALAAPLPPRPGGARVVWIIFDELSQTIAFGNRPSNLALPNLDRLRQESFYATSAESPSNRTEISLPSLILGEQVLEAFPEGPGDLRVKLRSREGAAPWSTLANVFDTARGLGYNTALAGWFHPYGRVLHRSLTKCYWTAGWLAPGVEEPTAYQPLLQGMWDRAGMQFVALPLAGHLPGVDPVRYNRSEKQERFGFLSDRAREIVADPEIGLALIHLPIPHPPAIYDRVRGEFSAEKGSYLDSLALVDRELGFLRRAMEDAGLWNGTAVLVSADHGWRTGLWRGTNVWTPEDEAASHQDAMGVPFLVRLPGQTSEVTYTKSFNTVVTRRLITGILRGEVKDAAGVRAAIESR